MDTFLVKDVRAKMHSLVRRICEDELGGVRTAAPVDAFNKLMRARNLSSLVDAVKRIGTFSSDPDFLGGRLVSGHEISNLMRDGSLTEPEQPALLNELYFDPFAADDGTTLSRTTRTPAKDTAMTIERMGLASHMGEIDEQGLYVIEPLQDWILLRNLLSVAARLGGVWREDKSNGEAILEHAGFRRVQRSSLHSRLARSSEEAFVAPILFNTFYREGNPIMNGLTYPSDLVNPFLERISHMEGRAFGLTSVRGLGKVAPSSTLFLTAPSAGVTKGSFAKREDHPKEDSWIWLTLQGNDQLALANGFLEELNRCLCAPAPSRRFWFDGDKGVYPDAPAALWETLNSLGESYLMTCRNCRRTIIASMHGGKAQVFCSDSCRATYNNAKSASAE